MAASFPSSVKSFTTKVAGDTIQPAHVNDLQLEVTAVENALLNGGYVTHADGLKFPGTQVASTDVNTLDDYEEGTITPTITSSGGGTPTYATQLGRYVKVGKLITFWIHVILATKGTLAAGNVSIVSLPYASDATANFNPGGAYVSAFAAMATSVASVSALITNGSQTIGLRHVVAAGSTQAAVTQVSDIADALDLTVIGSYYAAQ